jgi:hypothetical protein
MPKKRVAIAAVLVLALLAFAVALGTGKPSFGITVKCLRADRSGDLTRVSLEADNYTRHAYYVLPAKLQLWNGRKWEECRDGIAEFSQSGTVLPDANARASCVIKRFPSGSRLRVLVDCQRPRRGLQSFWLRIQLHILGEDHSISLNPFDSRVFICSDGVVASQEFVEP